MMLTVNRTAIHRPLAVLAFAAASCSVVPETGRSRIAWFPEDYMNTMGAQETNASSAASPSR